MLSYNTEDNIFYVTVALLFLVELYYNALYFYETSVLATTEDNEIGDKKQEA